MTDRETRLRQRIDRESDKTDRLRVQLAHAYQRIHELEQVPNDVARLRARLRDVQRERDEALAALWRERDNRYATAGTGESLDGTQAGARGRAG